LIQVVAGSNSQSNRRAGLETDSRGGGATRIVSWIPNGNTIDNQVFVRPDGLKGRALKLRFFGKKRTPIKYLDGVSDTFLPAFITTD